MPRSARKTAWGCARVSRRSNDRRGNPLGCASGIRGPPRYGRRKSPFHRRARACPSPCNDLHGKRPGPACGVRAGRTIAGETRSDARMETSEGPRDTVGENPPFTVGRGPVPRHASICTENGLGLRAGFAQVERSRGTGPRATKKKRAVYRRARACPSPGLDLHGKRPWSACGFRAGRTIAGDRPPRYEKKTVLEPMKSTSCLTSCEAFELT